MPLKLRIESELDERSATAAASRAQRIYTDAAQNMSRELSEGLTKGSREGGRAIEQMADQARTSYKRVGAATDELRDQERQLKEMREEGARGVEVQAERVRAARKRERLAIKEAAAAYDEYEEAAKRAGEAGERSVTGGLRGAAGAAAGSGKDAANSFMSGFAGSSALMSLGARGGPIGLALAGAAALGYMTGKVLVDNIAAGMATMQTRDVFQARLGVDEATMSRYGDAAANAFTSAWGESIPDNMRAVQFAIQGGVIDRDASDGEIEATIAQMQALAQIMEVDVSEAAKSAGQLIRGGFAANGTEAADIIVSGFQRGLDITGDWLDTIDEYSTQWRNLGLEGDDALGLIQQGLEGGARNADVVADSLKEFFVKAVDGSEQTAKGFDAIGFNADDMRSRLLAGGDSARDAFGATLQAINGLGDETQKAAVWLALFGTKWEDMGDAANAFDLSTARNEFANTEGAIDQATNTLSTHVNQWDVLGRQIDVTFAKLKEWLADSALGEFLGADVPRFLGSVIAPDPARDAQAQADAAVAAERERRNREGQTGSGFSSAGDAQRARRGLPPLGGDAPVPGARTPILSDREQAALDEANGGGSTSLPAAPSLPLQYTSTAGMPTAIANAQTRLDEARHAVAEKQARVNQLQQSNIATEEDNQKARNDLTKAERDQQQAEQALHDSRMSAYEKQAGQMGQMSSAMSEFGAQLDSDFGISDGLAGIADNLVRFVASLAMAPLVGQLSAISNAHGDEGSGVMGMLASSGALGPRFMPGYGSTGGSGGYGGGGYGMPVGGSGGTPTEAQVKQIAAAFGLSVTSEDRPGDPGYHGQGMALDVSNGSGNTPQMRAFADYMAQNFGGSLKELIYSDGSFSGLIGDGKNVTGSGYYSQGTLSEHENHVHVAAAWGSGASNGSPVPVNVMGGPGSMSGFNWDAVAAKESSGNWQNADTGNNGHYGGLQFSPSTWNAFGGQEFAPMPHMATREQQMAVADRTAFTGYNGTKPQGLGAWEVITNGSTAGDGITVNSQPSSPYSPLPPLGSMPGGGGGGPGTGMPNGLMVGGPTPLGAAQSYPAGPAGGGLGLGGMAMDGLMAATSGLDMMMPGAGAAAKIGIQVANRTAKYGGQVAGILTSGFLDTITPAGDKPQASIGNSWLGKLAGGIAGASAALPNAAGGKPPGPMGGQGQQGGQGGNTINNTLNMTNNRTTEDFAGNQAVREMGAANWNVPGRQ